MIGPNGVDYDALVAEWSNLPGVTDGASVMTNLATLAEMTVESPRVDVRTSTVIGKLMLAGKLLGLSDYAVEPPVGANAQAVAVARQLMFSMTSAHAPASFETSIPEVYETVSGMLDALVSDPLCGLSSDDQNAILALTEAPQTPWWLSVGLPSLPNVSDLIIAGIITAEFAASEGIV